MGMVIDGLEATTVGAQVLHDPIGPTPLIRRSLCLMRTARSTSAGSSRRDRAFPLACLVQTKCSIGIAAGGYAALETQRSLEGSEGSGGLPAAGRAAGVDFHRRLCLRWLMSGVQ
jgi:hypothetical protein